MAQLPGLIPDGRKIREIRIGRGITVTNLAKQIGRSRSSIWNIEGRNLPFSRVFASQIANTLGVKVEDIVLKSDEEAEDGSDEEEQALAS